MNTIVKKDRLLVIIQENRDGHRALYEKAFTRYREFVIEDLTKKLMDAQAGHAVEQMIKYPVPEDHTRDYDRVLMMLNLDVRDEIELGEYEIASYVMDDWDWKRQWTTSNAAYLVQ